MGIRHGWLAGWLACTLLAAPSWAQDGRDVIVGRADADASGGWPVALWMVDGDHSSLIVRTERGRLGALPDADWRAVDAQALMSLERFGAPKMQRWQDADPCPAALRWGRPVEPAPNAHWPGERDELQHPPCGAGDCGSPAWRVALPAGEVLPLARLLPGLAAERPQWLVLYVVHAHRVAGLRGVARLQVPRSLQATTEQLYTAPSMLPAAAASQFPAIHAAMLEHAADAQGLARRSVLMRIDSVGAVSPPRYLPVWTGSAEQRKALGLDGEALRDYEIVRLLLRLEPGDSPAELTLQPGRQSAEEWFMPLQALQPRAGDLPSCRSRLAELACQPACIERVAQVGKASKRWFYEGGATIEPMGPGERMQACQQACEQQKSRLSEAMQRNFEARAARQQQGWQRIEALTGRPASNWQAR